jgi:hypothetical protein
MRALVNEVKEILILSNKNTVADALERLAEEESHGIFEGTVKDLAKAKLMQDSIFSMDGMEMAVTENYPGAGQITIYQGSKGQMG